MSENIEIDVEEPEIEAEDTEEAKENEEISIDEAVKGIKQQLEAEKAERQREAALRADMEARVNRAVIEKEEAELQLVSGAIETLSRDSEIIKAELAKAMRMGDHEAAVDLQEQMTKTAGELDKLRNGIEAMKARQKPQIQPVQTGDPVETLARTLAPQSADWIRKHPEYVRDPKLNRQMISAHELTVGRGITPNTDEYFESVENLLGMKKPERRNENQTKGDEWGAKVVQHRDASPAAAPVSRGRPSSSRVSLTPEEVEAAEISNITPKQYFEIKMRVQNEKNGKGARR